MSTTASATPLRGIALAAIALAAYGWMADPYLLRVATEILLVGTAVMSLNLLIGQGGLVSLCHGAIFGGAAYAAALAAQHAGAHAALVLAAGIAAGTLLALAAALLSLRSQGLFLLVVTLIAGQLLWEIAFHWRDVTGGADGLRGFGATDGAGAWARPLGLYALSAAWAGASFLLLHHFIRRPVGIALQGLRDQPLRMQALGYGAARLRLLAFAVSGAVAGGAGALYPFLNHYISPESVHWSFSATLIIMGVIGGVRTLHGAYIGAAIYLLIQTYLSSYTDRWQLLIGLLFVATVLFMPNGIASGPRIGRRP